MTQPNIEIHKITGTYLPPFNDNETRLAVATQKTLEKNTLIVIGAIIAISIVANVTQHGHIIIHVFPNILSSLILYFILSRAAKYLLIRPACRSRFGKRAQMLTDHIVSHVRPTKYQVWSLPVPAFLCVDLEKNYLYLETAETDFIGIELLPAQILDIKIERQQTVHTKTNHSMLGLLFFRFLGVGFGRSNSVSKTVEQAFLEIVVCLSPTSAPFRVSFDFGDDRRAADDWHLTITRMLKNHLEKLSA